MYAFQLVLKVKRHKIGIVGRSRYILELSLKVCLLSQDQSLVGARFSFYQHPARGLRSRVCRLKLLGD